MSHRKPQLVSESCRSLLELYLLGMAGKSLVTGPTNSAQDDTEMASANVQALFPAGAPAAASGYSPGVLAQGQRIVMVSGQGPEDLNADMETQIRQTFERVGLVLEAGGATFRNVIMIRPYFVHLLRDLPTYRKVRLDYLAEPFPASTALGVTELAIPGLEVEIEAVAIV